MVWDILAKNHTNKKGSFGTIIRVRHTLIRGKIYYRVPQKKVCGNVYYQVNRADVLLQNMVRLASFNAINVGKREIGILAPRREHEGVCPHEGQGQPAKQLARDLPLLNPLAPCQRACQ